MDKQDPLAHPLLQWYKILVFLLMKTASFSTACFKGKKKAYFTRPAMLQFYKPMRPGDFKESLMTLTLIKTCISQGEENAVLCTTHIYNVFDSSLSIVFKKM